MCIFFSSRRISQNKGRAIIDQPDAEKRPKAISRQDIYRSTSAARWRGQLAASNVGSNAKEPLRKCILHDFLISQSRKKYTRYGGKFCHFY